MAFLMGIISDNTISLWVYVTIYGPYMEVGIRVQYYYHIFR